jgi:hypothetical protein
MFNASGNATATMLAAAADIALKKSNTAYYA